MNKKTFTVAIIFLCVTVLWLGVNIYWYITSHNTMVSIVIAVVFILAGLGMVYNEGQKKKRRHLEEVNKHQIP